MLRPTAVSVLVLSSLLWLAACSPETPPAPPSPPPAVEGSYLLARHPEDVVDVSLPPRSRPGPTPATFAVAWTPQGDTFVGDNPTTANLKNHVPADFRLVSPAGVALPFAATLAPGTWSTDGRQLLLSPPEGALPDEYSVQYVRAQERLARLNRRDTEDTDDVAFMMRSERIQTTHHHGVYLPAPAQATWRVTVPLAGRLLADLSLIKSPLRADPPSDGASLVVEVLVGEVVQEVARVPVLPDQWEDVEADLSPWSGQEIGLRLRSEPGDSSQGDYLMVGEPTLYTPKTSPRRIVLIFADTLRPDHMGMYGYARETTPNLDRWAAERATVFTDVHSVAPWTYPAMRATLTGRMPDQWAEGPTLAERFGEAGWNTVAFVNNAYMGEPFEMHQGWSWHFLDPSLDGDDMRRSLLKTLEKSADRDLLVLVQLMETHLPYDEPEPYRSLFVSPAQAAAPPLPDPIRRSDLLNYTGDSAVLARYITDRYDQSLRQLDRAVAPLFEKLQPDDTIIFFSDHGEEFLDHGSWGHGQSLHEELLRVALMIDTPGIPEGGRVEGRASLLDLTPTLLDIAGLPPDPSLPGTSLLPAARGTPLPRRPLGFGHVFYGADAWAALEADSAQKVSSRGGTLVGYDLAADPGETSPQTVEDREATTILEAGLGRPMVQAWRVVSRNAPLQRDPVLRLAAPGGFQAVWTGLEAPEIPPAEVVAVDADTVEVRGGGGVLPQEVFAVPRQPDVEVQVIGAQAPLTVGRMWLPLPRERLKTTAASVEGQLRALGYLE